MRVLVLAADEDDGLSYVLKHPEIRPHRVTMVWPSAMDRVKSSMFDKLMTTSAIMSHDRLEVLRAACLTRIIRTGATR